MIKASRRLAIIGAVWAVLIGTACFDVSTMLAPSEASKSVSDRGRQFRGELWASFNARGVSYESNRIPFVAPLKDNRAEIPAQSVRSMLATLRQVPAASRFTSPEDAPPPSLNYGTSDAAYQALYDTGAANMPSEAPSEDLYVTTSEMDALTGTTVYSQDLIGDGSAIAELVVERAPGSPYLTASVTLNGQVMHTSTIDFQASDGGYSQVQHNTASYDRYGSTTTSGTWSSQHDVEYTSRPDAVRVHYANATIAKVWNGLEQLLAPIAPTTVYAFDDCQPYYHKRMMFLSGLAMIFAGAHGNVPMYAIAAGSYAYSLRAYMRCRRAQ